MVIVGRHINGIAINPLEYLLGDNGEAMGFTSEDAAKEFLKGKGFTDDEFYWLAFKEYLLSNEGQGVSTHNDLNEEAAKIFVE